ncbi:transcription repressor NadR [Romboutsia maritimum]|uniref:Transcription repressor NadR n=1 Tax=Romboutsia maritimum TaxID=2020948 RepID=A0A371IPY8_9FIRM|nr:transcription repressor NadR [Romboutsia maritimum]RDY22533.1 transcription repressor NadR [Romboutsia maritimum]
MDSNERRYRLLQLLNSAKLPLKGNELAKEFSVSRQVIVQDIAIIRASGSEIIATPQGYIVYNKNKSINKQIKCKNHKDYNEIYDELKIIIDRGGIVENVIVEHPIYGQIKAILNISTNIDLDNFINKIKNDGFKQLSLLTTYNHIHTIQTSNEEVMDAILNELKKKDILS